MSTDCGTPDDKHSSKVTLEVRFQDDGAAPQQRGILQRLAAAAPGPATHDDVARILVDITFADSGLPFYPDFELTRLAPDEWRGDVKLLPRDQQLRFSARALSATGDVAFSGETLATLTADNQALQIPLAPAQDNQTFQLPRLTRIVYPPEVLAGQEEHVTFTIEANAGTALGLQITADGSSTPSDDFSPATSTVTLTRTVADFVAVYTPPDVTADTDIDYQVTITAATPQSAVAITTNFRTHVRPRPPGIANVGGTQLSTLFHPVILSLTANGSRIPGTVELAAAVSDDSAPAQLAYQWSYAPAPGTPTATFANHGQGNPGLFQGYTVTDQGTITLAVTDEHGGTTTLHYQLAPDQFADVIHHADLKRIVAGQAHTCVLTGQDRVHCWGDNQFGQLGYGNTTNVGDTSTRLPYTPGDVPLPVSDPVLQLAAGNNHTCVLMQSGLVYCWGDNQFGQLGHDRTENLGDDEPVTKLGYVPLGGLAIRIAAGGDHTCAVLQSGALRCWGRNDFGQLGRGDTENLGDNEPVDSVDTVDLGAGVTVKDVALGGDHTCALLTTGAVRCWGHNDFGQLGYGHTNNLGDDEPINNLPDVSLTGTVRKLAAGGAHTCALTVAGTLRCWGRGDSGQLGQGFGGDPYWGNAPDELPSNLPGDVDTGARVSDVVAGGSHTCALSSDGQLKCWGRGDSGQLGYGNFDSVVVPPASGVNLDGSTAYEIAAGAAHTCALRTNGTARCWGDGGSGRLGRGNTETSATATGDVDVQIFSPVPACGDRTTDPGEQCDDGNTINGDACDNNCTIPRCGNAITDPREQCDDGNTSNGDACDNNCTLPVCGNAILDPGEQCDDGNAVNIDACTNACHVARCGDGIVSSNEECDDGNTVNGDACDNNCTAPRCGNSVVDPGEQCDDANSTNGDTCDSNCTTPRCGNGIVDPAEQCDDGNAINGDVCENNCTLPVCGNGIKDGGEQCDDGNPSNGDTCESNCTLPVCGNGIRDSGEQCDDGNTSNGDACESNCTTPRCGNGIVDPGEQCDDDNAINGDGCDNNCTTPRCGNGICSAGESCSSCPSDCGPCQFCGDGTCNGSENSASCPTDCPPRCGDGICNPGENSATCPPDCPPHCGDGICNPGENSATCPGDCPPVCGDGICNGSETCSSCPGDCGVCQPRCGNGVVEPGEQCDDGNSTNGDSCESDCTLPFCGNGIVDSGEECDDGSANGPGDGCSRSCRIRVIICPLC